MSYTAINVTKTMLTTSISNNIYIQREFIEPIEVVAAPEAHTLELDFLPWTTGGRACFLDRWSPTRFEPIGSTFFLPASQAVHMKNDCRQQVCINCTFVPGAVERWFDGELEWTDSRLIGSLDIGNPIIRNLLVRLSDEVRMPGFASEAIAELISAEIVIELGRYYLGVTEQQSTGGLAPWRLRLIDERLADPGQRASLSELAALCNLSPRQLTRAFRASRGISIGRYIVESRIDEARRLLTSEQNVKSIAHDLGFNSPSHFHTAFRRLTGETPGQYRQRLRRSMKDRPRKDQRRLLPPEAEAKPDTPLLN